MSKSNSKPETTSQQLFLNSDGQPLVFHLPPGATKRKLSSIIQQHGGEVTSRRLKNIICLADEKLWSSPTLVSSKSDCYWPTYVLDSVKRGTLLDLEKYRCSKGASLMRRITPEDNTSQGDDDDGFDDNDDMAPAKSFIRIPVKKKGRMHYTKAEDMNILKYLMENGEYNRAKGAAVWKTMQNLEITPHPAQSMMTRFRKVILTQLDQYNIPDSWKSYLTGDLAYTASSDHDDGNPVTGEEAREDTAHPQPSTSRQSADGSPPRQKDPDPECSIHSTNSSEEEEEDMDCSDELDRQLIELTKHAPTEMTAPTRGAQTRSARGGSSSEYQDERSPVKRRLLQERSPECGGGDKTSEMSSPEKQDKQDKRRSRAGGNRKGKKHPRGKCTVLDSTTEEEEEEEDRTGNSKAKKYPRRKCTVLVSSEEEEEEEEDRTGNSKGKKYPHRKCTVLVASEEEEEGEDRTGNSKAKKHPRRKYTVLDSSTEEEKKDPSYTGNRKAKKHHRGKYVLDSSSEEEEDSVETVELPRVEAKARVRHTRSKGADPDSQKVDSQPSENEQSESASQNSPRVKMRQTHSSQESGDIDSQKSQQKRGRGRPRKDTKESPQRKKTSKNPAPDSQTLDSQPSQNEQSESGSPISPKVKTRETYSSQESGDIDSQKSPQKRGRGRPRKDSIESPQKKKTSENPARITLGTRSSERMTASPRGLPQSPRSKDNGRTDVTSTQKTPITPPSKKQRQPSSSSPDKASPQAKRPRKELPSSSDQVMPDTNESTLRRKDSNFIAPSQSDKNLETGGSLRSGVVRSPRKLPPSSQSTLRPKDGKFTAPSQSDKNLETGGSQRSGVVRSPRKLPPSSQSQHHDGDGARNTEEAGGSKPKSKSNENRKEDRSTDSDAQEDRRRQHKRMSVLGIMRALSQEFSLTMRETQALMFRHSGNVDAVRYWVLTGRSLPGEHYWTAREDRVLLKRQPDHPDWQKLEEQRGLPVVLQRIHWLRGNH